MRLNSYLKALAEIYTMHYTMRSCKEQTGFFLSVFASFFAGRLVEQKRDEEGASNRRVAVRDPSSRATLQAVRFVAD